MPRPNTLIATIQEILRAHPKGMTTAQVERELEKQGRAHGEDCVKVILSQLAQKRILRRVDAQCDTCARRAAVYKIMGGNAA